MSKSGQEYLIRQVIAATNYCAQEFDMTWIEAVGVLHMIAHHFSQFALEDTGCSEYVSIDDDDDEEEDDEAFPFDSQ